MAVPAWRRRRRPRIRTSSGAGTSTQRGYGYAWQQLRRQYMAAYVPGITLCWRCGQPISEPPRRVHLGHDDDDRTIVRGLEHASCNLGAGQAAGNRKRGQQQRTTGRRSREW